MTTEKKLLGISPSGGATDVADVFSTYLYTGNNSTQTITNGIDLAGEGGLVWIKVRESNGGEDSHRLYDTERGVGNSLRSDSTSATQTQSNSLGAFNSNGFYLNGAYLGTNGNGYDYASFTFRKKSAFFDCVTFSGNEATSRMIAHSLGSTPAVIIVKSTTANGAWYVYHTSLGRLKVITLNSTGAAYSDSGPWYNQAPTSTHFGVGSDGATNGNGQTYVAYLFADNSSEDAEEQMIKCGSWVAGSSYIDVSTNLGWEPQYVMYKNATGTGGWYISDNMRGTGASSSTDIALEANTSGAEFQMSRVKFNSTGFTCLAGTLNDTYIYMAIRAPMMVEPSAATDVFATVVGRSSHADGRGNFLSGFPVDFGIGVSNTGGGDRYASSRLTGKEHMDPATTAAGANNAAILFDYSDGWGSDGFGNYHSYMWKRAKGYMDAVAYSGVSGSPQVINHSLGVTPEMIWTKSRSTTGRWLVLHKDLTYALAVQTDGAETGSIQINTPTSTSFTAADSSIANGAGVTYIAYLFATLAGISKVGSYTGNGSNQTIACGFSAGSRFILIKRTDATGDWYFWDSLRGIVAGNDPHLSLNTTAAQVTNDDSIDPANSGFIVNQVSASNINVSSATYIFYAIA